MSIETWKAEFYPVPADSDEAKADPIEHSLRKWRGLRADALERHGLTRGSSVLTDSNKSVFSISGDTCALCEVHYRLPNSSQNCLLCPLAIHLGRKCDHGLKSPYQVNFRSGDPEPMIAALEAAQVIQSGKSLQEEE